VPFDVRSRVESLSGRGPMARAEAAAAVPQPGKAGPADDAAPPHSATADEDRDRDQPIDSAMTTPAGSGKYARPVPARGPLGQTSPVPHRDFVEKVAGTLPYADDWGFPGMLHGVVVRARVTCALIARVDTSAAKQVRGVRVVVTLYS